jgi:hypothetical protein
MWLKPEHTRGARHAYCCVCSTCHVAHRSLGLALCSLSTSLAGWTPFGTVAAVAVQMSMLWTIGRQHFACADTSPAFASSTPAQCLRKLLAQLHSHMLVASVACSERHHIPLDQAAFRAVFNASQQCPADLQYGPRHALLCTSCSRQGCTQVLRGWCSLL